jgi:hypothetical protein
MGFLELCRKRNRLASDFIKRKDVDYLINEVTLHCTVSPDHLDNEGAIRSAKDQNPQTMYLLFVSFQDILPWSIAAKEDCKRLGVWNDQDLLLKEVVIRSWIRAVSL